jgi:hypothetical protein
MSSVLTPQKQSTFDHTASVRHGRGEQTLTPHTVQGVTDATASGALRLWVAGEIAGHLSLVKLAD